MRFGFLSVCAIAVTAAAFAACGGSDDGTSEDALKERVKSSAEAIFQNEAREAYNAYSEECREDLSFSEFRSSLAVATVFFEGFTDMKLEDLEVTEVKVRNFEDDSAEAAIVVRSKDGDDDAAGFFGDDEEYSRWEVEDGQWVNVDCEDLALGGSDDDDRDDDDADPAPTSPAAGRTPTVPATPGPKPKVGQAAPVEDARYTVNEVRDNLEGDEFTKPPAGKRWLAIDVTIEAGGDVTYGSFDFSLQDTNLFVYESEFVFADEPAPRLSSGELGPGDAVRGWVFFEVPTDTVVREIRVSPGFGERAVVIADLSQR